MDSEQVYFVIKHLMQACWTASSNYYFQVYRTLDKTETNQMLGQTEKDIRDIKSSAMELKNNFPKEIIP